MKTLDDAWNWYIVTRKSLERLRRFGSNYWNDDSLRDAAIWKDDRFKNVEAETIVSETNASLDELNDLAIVVLFSVFESQVRAYLLEKVKPEADSIAHPLLKDAAQDALRGIEEGSFYVRVLAPLKDQKHVPSDLVTQINQIRDYRNWVAHGRRERVNANNITPRLAYLRLKVFLEALAINSESDLPSGLGEK